MLARVRVDNSRCPPWRHVCSCINTIIHHSVQSGLTAPLLQHISFRVCVLFWCDRHVVASLRVNMYIAYRMIAVTKCIHFRFVTPVTHAVKNRAKWHSINCNYDANCLQLCPHMTTDPSTICHAQAFQPGIRNGGQTDSTYVRCTHPANVHESKSTIIIAAHLIWSGIFVWHFTSTRRNLYLCDFPHSHEH